LPPGSYPDVERQVYVFAKGILQDAGFAWQVEGSVRGYAANTVAIQQPAPGTRVRDTGAPLVVLRLVANAHYDGPDSNTQSDFWAYLHANATVVVGKEPLWTQIDGKAGARIHVTIDATNIAV